MHRVFGALTLCPIRHCVFADLTYHFSKSLSLHCLFLVFAKSRNTVTNRPIPLF